MIKKLTLLFLFIIILWLIIAFGQPFSFGPHSGQINYQKGLTPAYKNIAYANKSKSEALDLFLPEGNGPFPLVINIHGGAFRFGSKEMLDAQIAIALLKSGIAVATINYRLSDEAKFPAAVQDAKASIRFLRANAVKYRLNPKKIIVFGQSAGGNIASLIGTTGIVTDFDDPELGNADVSAKVQGVINWFGLTDFAKMDEQLKIQGCSEKDQNHGLSDSPEAYYLGAALAEIPGIVRKANPVTYITKDTPPFLLQKGDEDCLVPIDQSKQLYDALKAVGVKAEFEILKGVGHGDMKGSKPVFLSDKNVKRVLTFIESIFKQP